MAHTATWIPPGRTAPWPAPPQRGVLATVQAFGDMQCPWEDIWPLHQPNTLYDAVGFDIADHMIRSTPDARIQMGDISDHSPLDKQLILDRFDLFDQWCGAYGIDVFKVMGNHDIVGDGWDLVITPQEWAAHMGYTAPSYVIDLGQVRVLVIGPTGTGEEIEPGRYHRIPCRPLTQTDVAWIDARLTEDPRPTLLAVHAPLLAERPNSGWWNVTSTVAAGKQATDLLAVINAHENCIGLIHGHTHNPWDASAPNTRMVNVGSRDIAVVDASAVYDKTWIGGGRSASVTFYVSVLDDGRSIDVRWRQHELSQWGAVPGLGRVTRLTAT